MCFRRNYFRGLQNLQRETNYFKHRTCGMEYELDLTRHKKYSPFTAHVIRTAMSFMPWSCRIPLGEGVNDGLCQLLSGNKIFTEANLSLSTLVTRDMPTHFKSNSLSASWVAQDISGPILPGLPDDVAKYCLALNPRSHFPVMAAVCKKWRSFIRSKEFLTVRKLAGLLEEWIYILTMDPEGKESHWEVLDCQGQKIQLLPSIPGPAQTGFGVVVLNGKLLVIAGYSLIDGVSSASADVYEYDCCLNSWSQLSSMNVARYNFACAEVNGKVYVVGGYGMDGDNLSSVEVYDPETGKWNLIESLRRPRWGCFACGILGKLYVMGGRSSFTIGNSKFVDVYNPERHTWCEIKDGCVMVTAHAVLGEKLFCMEWKNQRKLAIFDPKDNSWTLVHVPLTGSSSSVGFRFGILDGKLLLFSIEEEPGYRTLLYDPNALPGKEWQTSKIKPSGLCMCSVTIEA